VQLQAQPQGYSAAQHPAQRQDCPAAQLPALQRGCRAGPPPAQHQGCSGALLRAQRRDCSAAQLQALQQGCSGALLQRRQAARGLCPSSFLRQLCFQHSTNKQRLSLCEEEKDLNAHTPGPGPDAETARISSAAATPSLAATLLLPLRPPSYSSVPIVLPLPPVCTPRCCALHTIAQDAYLVWQVRAKLRKSWYPRVRRLLRAGACVCAQRSPLKYSICRPVQTHVSQTCGTVCLFTPRTVF